MSTRAGILRTDFSTGPLPQNATRPMPADTATLGIGETQELRFTHLQLQRLVQQVFWPLRASAPRRVAFSSVSACPGSWEMCRRISGALAERSGATVYLADASPDENSAIAQHAPGQKRPPQNETGNSARPRVHVFPLLREAGVAEWTPEALRKSLDGLGLQRELTVIHAPPMDRGHDAVWLGQVTDGLVLLLEAHFTRRSVALETCRTLRRAGVKLLGTVLMERRFPIPPGLYGRL